MISFDKCNEMLKQTHLGDTFDLNKSFNCAGGELGKDACTGDGGSPLFCQISNRSDEYYQAGIVSWGIGCGQANVPGVYADVAQFVDWIEKTIKENEIREP